MLEVNDECPNCKCGTLGREEPGKLVCRGECGQVIDLGATGEFPDGKITDHDAGGLALSIGFDSDSNNIIIDFGTPVAWLGMTPEDAIDFAEYLIQCAKEHQG